MSRTFTLPSGRKVRTASHRAHVLIHDDNGTGTARVIQRSDSVATLIAARRRRGHHSDVRYYMGATATGDIVMVGEHGALIEVAK